MLAVDAQPRRHRIEVSQHKNRKNPKRKLFPPALSNRLILSTYPRRAQKAANAGQVIALQIGFPDAARLFSAISATAGTVETICSLGASAVGGFGWYEVLLSTGALAELGGNLKGLFGAGDSSEAEAQRKIFEALQAIFESIQRLHELNLTVLEEQREHFDFISRNLGVVLQLTADDSFEGLFSCNRIVEAFDAVRNAPTGGAEASSDAPWAGMTAMKFVFDTDDSIGLHAANCYEWFRRSGAGPIRGFSRPKSIRSLFLHVVDDAIRVQPIGSVSERERLALSRQEYGYVDRAYPALSLLLQEYSALYEVDAAVSMLHPVETIPQLLMKIKLLPKRQAAQREGPSRVSQNDVLSDLGTRMGSLTREDARQWQIGSFLDQPLSSAPVVAALQGLLFVQPIVDFLGADGHRRIDDQALASRESSTVAGIMKDYYALGMIALPHETLATGDILIPFINDILVESDRLDRLEKQSACEKGGLAASLCSDLYATVTSIACSDLPDPKSGLLCAKVGKAKFDTLQSSAKRAVQELPTLRQNVLTYRLWRESSRSSDGGNAHWSPSFQFAIESVTATPSFSVSAQSSTAPTQDPIDLGILLLQRQFTEQSFWKLASVIDLPVTDSFIEKGAVFARLSGECGGIDQKPQAGKVVCEEGTGCDARVTAKPDGKPYLNAKTIKDKEFHTEDQANDWELYALRRCVLAALPEAGDFAVGRLYDSYDSRLLRSILDEYVDRLTVLDVYANSGADRQWNMIFNVR